MDAQNWKQTPIGVKLASLDNFNSFDLISKIHMNITSESPNSCKVTFDTPLFKSILFDYELYICLSLTSSM